MKVLVDLHVSLLASKLYFYISTIKIHDLIYVIIFTAIAKEDWSISRTRSQSRLHLSSYRKEQGLSLKGKAGFSEEFLDKLDSEVRSSVQDNREQCRKDLNLGWERLRLSDGDLLRSSGDREFQKLKVQ